jgi:hypothetical protein
MIAIPKQIEAASKFEDRRQLLKRVATQLKDEPARRETALHRFDFVEINPDGSGVSRLCDVRYPLALSIFGSRSEPEKRLTYIVAASIRSRTPFVRKPLQVSD